MPAPVPLPFPMPLPWYPGSAAPPRLSPRPLPPLPLLALPPAAALPAQGYGERMLSDVLKGPWPYWLMIMYAAYAQSTVAEI